jgi:flagellar hook assembly protein FlgD
MRMIKRIPAAMLNQGVNQYLWNGTDQDGTPVSPGIFILEIKTASQSKIIKILKNR